MTTHDILKKLMGEKKMNKAELGRTIGIVTPKEIEKDRKKATSKATDYVGKRMRQKNISVKLLSEMLAPLGYTIAVVPRGRSLKEDEYEVTLDG